MCERNNGVVDIMMIWITSFFLICPLTIDKYLMAKIVSEMCICC